MAFKIVFLVILIFSYSWCYNNLSIEDFTKENITEQIKKEKTINTVQKTRQKRNQEVQRIMDNI
ncbi:TPA: hypothetical protein IAC10_10750 [Candidatus Scatousia excrementigallinarum]|uniref:Uncharacterized protein n=1 Tax=Candidatus Scatousia excrementigallinarum TaxID=2840935 RepID=A0A9D1F089_9BACT|nr:hypothetical protein [Candidatus Scatousia excrementigallinarum]